jgi:hypothetical protein
MTSGFMKIMQAMVMTPATSMKMEPNTLMNSSAFFGLSAFSK